MGHNVFLTGPAGSGKTYVLGKYIEYLKSKHISVAVTASTGIAATHLNGKTIHSWSGLGIKQSLDEKSLRRISRNSRFGSRILKTKTLIIDEISMLHASQLDAVDQILQSVCENQLPFGGIQTVFCGDFFQLPPVQKENNTPVSFAYSAEIWNQMDVKTCYLDEQHRQKDNKLMKVLNDIRRNCVDDETKGIVATCQNKIWPDQMCPARLFTHNIDVDAINERELQKIPGAAFAYNMRAYGKKKLVEFLRKSCLAPERLMLKKDARVMFVKNNFEEGYVNGTTGTVIGFDKETKMPIIRANNGQKITAKPVTWEMEEDDEVIASIKQIPLRLAWAITVHKSQGMSLDAAEIDLSKSFEYGMGYVALSRVRSMAGLSVLGVNDMAFQVHAAVQKMDQEFVRQSEIIVREISNLNEDEKNKKQQEFAGEKNYKQADENRKSDKNYFVDEIRKNFAKAYMPWTESEDKKLRELFAKGKTTRELSEMFERKRGAIHSRLRKISLIRD